MTERTQFWWRETGFGWVRFAVLPFVLFELVASFLQKCSLGAGFAACRVDRNLRLRFLHTNTVCMSEIATLGRVADSNR